MKTRKIRLYPNVDQKKILSKWFGVARWTYNNCLNLINLGLAKCSKKDLRKLCLNQNAHNGRIWVGEVPYDIRDAAMIDLMNGYKSNFAKRDKNGGDGNFTMKFRSIKAPQQSITIHKKHWGRKNGVYSFLSQIYSAEPIFQLKCDSHLTLTRTGEYYICIPINATANDNQVRNKVVALDPGVRTFQTSFDNEGIITHWGSGGGKRICKLSHTYAHIRSLMSACTGKEKRNLKKASLKVQLKIRNIVADLHRKLAKWLCVNYSVILLPTFKSSQMLKKNKRKINKETAYTLATWSHYRFQQHLLNKSREYKNCKVILCEENYTSMTCGNCGNLKRNLGGQKTYHCGTCSSVLDRDVNGARNILIKFLTENVTPNKGHIEA